MLKYLTVIILLSIFPNQLVSNEDNGIAILQVNSTLACSGKLSPLLVREHFGYISTPDFDGFHYYPKNINCSWILMAEENNIWFIRFNSLELDYYLKDGLYLYDGYNTSAPLIERYSGSQRNLHNFRSPGSVLLLKFVGVKDPKTVGFDLYFEQRPVQVRCNSSQISCRNQIKCVHLENRCDTVDDCGDGTDEQNCANQTHQLDFDQPCGRPRITPAESFLRIVGGHRAIPGSWPWMVSMRRPTIEPDGHTCGATVINRQWIVTAAHCFNDYYVPNEWQLHFGKYDKLVKDKNEVIRYIDSIHIHHNYKGNETLNSSTSWYTRKANDIALVKLNAPLPLNNTIIAAVCLPDSLQVVIAGQMCLVTGWGDTRLTGDELVLKQAKVPLISNQKCREWMPYFDVGKGMLCAGHEEGGQDSCQGDSGGPLVWQNSKLNRYELIGIVSTGGSCGGRKEAGIYTKVSDFVEWIKQMINKNETSKNGWYEVINTGLA